MVPFDLTFVFSATRYMIDRHSECAAMYWSELGQRNVYVRMVANWRCTTRVRAHTHTHIYTHT